MGEERFAVEWISIGLSADGISVSAEIFLMVGVC